MGPVPLDDTHRWLEYPLTRFQARENFTKAWERLGIPFVLLSVNDARLVESANDDLLVQLYAHQHVRLTPVVGRWCCTPPVPRVIAPLEDSSTARLSAVYYRECMYCDRPAKARGMCWMHYSRVSRHGDPYQARPYAVGAGR